MIKIAGIGFIVFGVISVVQQSFSYTQTKLGGQTGSLIIEQTEFRTVPLPPIIGAGLILAGFAALLVRTSRAS